MAEGKIYAAISNVMKDVGVVGKTDKNDYDHYAYRGIDAVMNALNPAMVKNKVFVTPTIIDSHREERQGKNTVMVYSVLTVKYTFYTDDGSSVECVVIGEAMDRSDKSTNKALSAAFKYACFQTFCIPTEEMIDSESETIHMPPKAVATEQELNQRMIDSVDPDLLPSQTRTHEQRMEKIKAEQERTGINDTTLLGFLKAKSWDSLTDAQYIVLMKKLKATKGKTA